MLVQHELQQHVASKACAGHLKPGISLNVPVEGA